MDTLNPTIISHLERLDIDSSSLDTKIIAHLEKIENVFEIIFSNQVQLTQSLKNNKPSLSKLSTDAKIARQTLYNNPVLKNYIELRINDYKANDIVAKADVTNAQARISELTDVINKLQVRDVNIELLNHKITLLENELKLKRKENLELRKRYENIINTQFKSSTTSKNDIIQFPQK